MKKDKRQKKEQEENSLSIQHRCTDIIVQKKHYINQFIGRKIFVSKKRKQQLIELIQFLTNLTF